MGQCDFEVETSGPIVPGHQVTIRLTPPLSHPCKFEIEVNGQPASLDDFGGLRVHGIGGSGSITITPQTPLPWGTIRFNVVCPNCSRSFDFMLPGGASAPDPSTLVGVDHHHHHDVHHPHAEEEREVITIFGIPIYRHRRRLRRW